MPTDVRIQILIEQLQTILILLERPVVQQQLFALAVIFVLAAGLSRGLGGFLLDRPRFRFRVAIEHLDFPLVAIILSWLAILLFAQDERPAGLLPSRLRAAECAAFVFGLGCLRGGDYAAGGLFWC